MRMGWADLKGEAEGLDHSSASLSLDSCLLVPSPPQPSYCPGSSFRDSHTPTESHMSCVVHCSPVEGGCVDPVCVSLLRGPDGTFWRYRSLSVTLRHGGPRQKPVFILFAF